MSEPEQKMESFLDEHPDNNCIGNCRDVHCRCIECVTTFIKRSEGVCIEEYDEFFDKMTYCYVCMNQHHRICYCNGFKIYFIKRHIEHTYIENIHNSFVHNYSGKLRPTMRFFKNRIVKNRLFYLFYKFIVLCIYSREKSSVRKFFSYKYFKGVVKNIINEKNNRNFCINNVDIVKLINENSDMFDLSELNVEENTNINFEYFANKIGKKIYEIVGPKRMKKLRYYAYNSKIKSQNYIIVNSDHELYRMINLICNNENEYYKYAVSLYK